jgi:hypothetical protein
MQSIYMIFRTFRVFDMAPSTAAPQLELLLERGYRIPWDKGWIDKNKPTQIHVDTKLKVNSLLKHYL